MASFYPFQRVKMVRQMKEYTGPPSSKAPPTGCILSLFGPKKMLVNTGTMSFVAEVNCFVQWDHRADACAQHTDQLEPILDLLDKEEEQEEEKVA